MTPESFSIEPLTAPWKSEAEVDALLQPFTQKLTELNITYSRNLSSEATFLEHYDNYFGLMPYASSATAQLLGGRLIPRSVIEQNNDGPTAVIRDITENSSFYVAATTLSVNTGPNKTQPISSNAVLPAWRDALLTMLVPSPWNFTQPRFIEEAAESQLTDSLIPKLTAVTPNSGTNMNEWISTMHPGSRFYGVNYDKLRLIKAKYDPGNLFYAVTAVGSDA